MTFPSPCPLSFEVTNGNWNSELYCENIIFMIENKFPFLTSSQENKYHQKFSQVKIVTRGSIITRKRKAELT